MRSVIGYEGLYSVTSCGKVYSHRRKKFLKPIPDKFGYEKVNLYKDGKMRTFLVHRLVAMAFIDNPENLPEVNHKSEVKTQNWVDNLEWATHAYNVSYGTRTERATESRLSTIYKSGHNGIFCAELGMYFDTQMDASRKTGVNQGEISRALSGKRKSAGKHPVTGERLTWRKCL